MALNSKQNEQLDILLKRLEEAEKEFKEKLEEVDLDKLVGNNNEGKEE